MKYTVNLAFVFLFFFFFWFGMLLYSVTSRSTKTFYVPFICNPRYDISSLCFFALGPTTCSVLSLTLRPSTNSTDSVSFFIRTIFFVLTGNWTAHEEIMLAFMAGAEMVNIITQVGFFRFIKSIFRMHRAKNEQVSAARDICWIRSDRSILLRQMVILQKEYTDVNIFMNNLRARIGSYHNRCSWIKRSITHIVEHLN